MGITMISRLIATALAALTLASCGLSGVRRQQDWSGVTDPRLYLACQVGNYGSGVLISVDENGATVLTVAHLVEAGDSVDVNFRDAASDTWVEYEGEVTVTTHPHKEDLALIRITAAEFHLPPQTTPIAAVMAPPDTFTVSLANIAFGAEERPFMLDAEALVHVSSTKSYQPDEHGETTWQLTKILLHGGIAGANSGSPVFRGDELVGLVESAPWLVTAPDGSLLAGVLVGAPDATRAVLDEDRSRR